MSANLISHYSGPWTETQIRHLLRRTLYGISRKDLEFFKEKSMEQCIEILFRPIPLPLLPINLSEGIGLTIFNSDDPIYEPIKSEKIKLWWINQIMNPQRNITEKMVLFWHNHFVIQFATVKDGRYSNQYLTLLRQHATGNFKRLLREITCNPAMLVYLNGNLNDKTAPNENYGRELQELFAIGKGPDSLYTESDVKAMAKVLSGWKDDKHKSCSYFDPTSHNTEDKTFSAFYNSHTIKGRHGDEGANETDELIDMICSNKEVSKFLCRKIYRWFVHSNIDERIEKNVITPLSEIMIQSNYEVKPVLIAMFSSALFYDSNLIGGMFKSPIDFFIGVVHDFDMDSVYTTDMDGENMVLVGASEMGQSVGDPPSVAGWPAYYEFPFYDKNWVTSQGLSARNKLIRILIGADKSTFPISFDFICFIRSLPDPGDAKAIISVSLKLLCCIQPGINQVLYLQGLLDSDPDMAETWAELWSIYQNVPADPKIENQILKRLQKTFCTIILLPEYQIM
jgi:hypothetical protein